MTTPAASTPTFLEKLGAEALDIVIAEANANETTILADADALIAAGDTDAQTALKTALTKAIPLVGAAVGAEIDIALEGLEAPAEAEVKTLFDAIVAHLQIVAKAWGG